MVEWTLAIIKPDAVGKGKIGAILARIEEEGFHILGMRLVRLTRRQAEGFYQVHRGKPFYESLTAFMSSGPCVPMVLEREDAIRRLREVMGATDPAKAAEGTLRRVHAESIERNAIHGSDAPETARYEIGYFYPGWELAG